MTLHPVVAAASEGVLPPWARAGKKRVAHMARVAELLDVWARIEGLDDEARRRQVALGYLHDAVKGMKADDLREIVPEAMRDLPDPVLHGPGAAALLRRDGVDDPGLLHAVSWHTLGHPELDACGLALYAADFLEPGRDLRNRWRGELRERMPHDRRAVVAEIVRARVLHLVERRRPVRAETLAFWNRFAEGRSWARASEV
ncbi:HD domain-containing protein [Gaopeijia maritima]|uniref:HD domain-containing protein n=1 Tax=Gaopeijia maritima TaxID=3119007 RepID=UPI003275E586